MNKTGIIILAAGNSSRLGRPKQLLPYKGKTLITHITSEALQTSLDPIVVVTGAFAGEVQDELKNVRGITIAYNQYWNTGMASGIVTGLSKTLSLQPDIAALILAVCDQPFINAGLFQQLIVKKDESRNGIVACAYSDTIGTPVLFARRYFEELSQLSGNEGAKKLLQRHKEDLATVVFPGGNIDIDTEEDYQKLF